MVIIMELVIHNMLQKDGLSSLAPLLHVIQMYIFQYITAVHANIHNMHAIQTLIGNIV